MCILFPSWCLAMGRVLLPLPQQHKGACRAGSQRDTSRSLCPWGQRVSLPATKSSIASGPPYGTPQAACGNGCVQQGGDQGGCVILPGHILPASLHTLLCPLTPGGCLHPTGSWHPRCFPKGITSEVSHCASPTGTEPASLRTWFHPAMKPLCSQGRAYTKRNPGSHAPSTGSSRHRLSTRVQEQALAPASLVATW